MTLTPRGRRLAIDVGTVRVGVATCDPDGILATPVETVRRSDDGSDIDRLVALVDEYDAVGVVVGRPVTLRGERGSSARDAEGFAARLAAKITPIPIESFDERLTTVTASQAMRAAGRNAKKQREVIDQAAAVAILQGWLDLQRARARRASDEGRPAGMGDENR
ncbi:Holliday junction resolvase RuvX [Gordonia jinhuaensis]|uniref:Putative pre-16S rRNA nuclease n=1 Tax=Gordonia jinhuaensis TaxID=1517702 RepID=A0A916T1Y3_9ACTN|nr:Holliday junction resolvase RuvX [Gordonia jinhuaensis]GGB25255.1 putative pre-16S rRNA nuclease [Gordonia jinhuaensis]